ncbi:MAG TPA: gephyrin-like molybdotransferase Glp [Segeticoccus sp.]|uniref:molybdotransferase-like divisome protein Glp n=1 Tax=Segeticoccus sp. TaxID=2706531 RepID=UPI002D7E6A08|nr:gephyrin-like molybdotransferase Glp [Segeticoccus sp.]HET8600062.1 gephyrin-like molybdotransferase Glp [Segeticoccus sp.]
MISIEEHLDRILQAVHQLPPREEELLAGRGCVLAEDVASPVALPGFTNSAMDGYAVRAADVSGATGAAPVTLPVLGDIPAGSTERHTMSAGECWRIMTGAPLPGGADAVVPVELTDRGLEQVRIDAAVTAGRHVRPQGEDVAVGDVVLQAGTLLGPRQVAVLAAVGRDRVRVVPWPRVVVLSTGDELIEPGQTPGFGQVVDSNGLMLTAAVAAVGAPVRRIGRVRDDDQSFRDALADALEGADALVTTGGVSAGAYDTVKAVLSRSGTVQFDQVAMQPGKPQGFGVLADGRVPVFTLPGNPVSALVSFEVFVAPALRQMAGQPAEPPTLEAVAGHDWSSPEGRTQFARVVLRREGADGVDWTADLAGGQGSHVLGGLAAAHALAVIPAEVTQVHAGDQVTCRLLTPLGTVA